MPPPPGLAPSRLPALLNGASVAVEPSRWWCRGAVVSGAGAIGMFAATAVASSDIWSVGGTTLVAVAAGLTYRGRRQRRRFPHLGRASGPWRAAGASLHELEILDEAHRIRALTPPVGYRDRRTVINPLADAFAIFTSPAWSDPWLADNRLTIDPVAEAAEIIDHVHRVTTLLSEVRTAAARVPPGTAARRTYADYERALLGALDDGLRRARALSAYRSEVARLAQLLASSRALPQAEMFAGRVLDVVSESARHELGARHLEQSRVHLRELESGLREITDLLATPPELPVGPLGPR